MPNVRWLHRFTASLKHPVPFRFRISSDAIYVYCSFMAVGDGDGRPCKSQPGWVQFIPDRIFADSSDEHELRKWRRVILLHYNPWL